MADLIEYFVNFLVVTDIDALLISSFKKLEVKLFFFLLVFDRVKHFDCERTIWIPNPVFE